MLKYRNQIENKNNAKKTDASLMKYLSFFVIARCIGLSYYSKRH